MDSTINSTRVPAPAFSGPASNHDTQNVINDGLALNLPDDGICLMGERALPDGKGASPTKLTSSRIVRCKKRTIISSVNTRTLDPLGRLEELAKCSKRQKYWHLSRTRTSLLSSQRWSKIPSSGILHACHFLSYKKHHQLHCWGSRLSSITKSLRQSSWDDTNLAKDNSIRAGR